MQSDKKVINVGIVGCGRVAVERHLPALVRLPAARIVAAADLQPDRLNPVADRYGIGRRTVDYRELLTDSNIDAIAVLTPTSAHAEIGAAVLAAGKHLFMEKPLALTIGECDRLLAAQRKAGGKALICFNLRWHRLVRQARERIRSGLLGEIRGIQSVYTHFRDGAKAPEWHRRLEQGGGVTFNESVHHFDLWRFLLQAEITEIVGMHRASPYYEDETSILSARLSNNILATMYNSFRTSPNSEVEIRGDRGRLLLSLYRFDGIRFYPSTLYPGDSADRIKKAAQSLLCIPGALSRMRQGGDFDATFYHIWQHFLDCLLYDREPEATLLDGKRAVQIALSAIESFRSQCTVHLHGE